MKTLFWLFGTYEDAETAIDHLYGAGLEDEQINVVVSEEVARDHMTTHQEEIKIKKSEGRGEDQEDEGLDALLGGERPIKIPDVGPVLAAGELATLVAKTAAAGHGLRNSLVELSIPEEAARTYREGVEEGGLLVFIRAEGNTAAHASHLIREKENPPMAAEAV